MTGEHAGFTLHAGDVNLIDLAGEGELFGRDEIEVEGGHGVVLRMASGEWRIVKEGGWPLTIRHSLFAIRSFRRLQPRASCPSRRLLRWCRPCRRQLPAGDRTCLRRWRGSP